MDKCRCAGICDSTGRLRRGHIPCGRSGHARTGSVQRGYDTPEGSVIGSDGIDLFDLFGGKGESGGSGGGGIGVNSYLWRASLDTIAFMPLSSADPFGGVIITDWYTPPETPGDRFKISVYILGRQLRADGIRVALFRQNRVRSVVRCQSVKDQHQTGE